MTDPVFLMTMHGDVQAIYENGSLTIYAFGDGDNTSSSNDPEIVFEEEYFGSWGWSRYVGKRRNGKIIVEEMSDRSNSIMGDTSASNCDKEYNDIHDYIQKSGMSIDKPLTVIQCKACNLKDCYQEFHKYFASTKDHI
jgi:hypothetical protein